MGKQNKTVRGSLYLKLLYFIEDWEMLSSLLSPYPLSSVTVSLASDTMGATTNPSSTTISSRSILIDWKIFSIQPKNWLGHKL